jgi:phosphonatase-like hydrolase
MPISLVVFDIAGTTVEDNTGVGGCLMQALEADGISVQIAQVNAVMGIPKPTAIKKLIEATGETPDKARIDAIHADFQARMIEYYKTSPDVREVPGAGDVFKDLRSRGIKVALDTGFDRSIVSVILDRLGWDATVLDATAASDEVPRGRPFPDLIYNLMRATKVGDAAHVAKVGDTPSDLQEGTAAGCSLVIGVTEGTHTQAQLASHPHTHLVGSIRDVPALIASV